VFSSQGKALVPGSSKHACFMGYMRRIDHSPNFFKPIRKSAEYF